MTAEPAPSVPPAPHLVRRDTDRGIAVLTLDSPHNRNALSAALVTQLDRALCAAGEDPAVRAVLLTHTGPAFCSGADLAATPEEMRDGPGALVALMRRIAELDRPVVAQVGGHVRAGGIGLVAACDIAVVAGHATFAFTEARLGLAPSVISIPVLARAEPRAVARYFLTGEVFGAPEAVRIGLASAAADALDAVLAGLRTGSPQGLAESKKLANAALLGMLAEQGAARAADSARLFGSAEAREGIRAAMARKDPPWAC